MAEKRVSVRLSATGGRQVKDALRGVGEAGQQGFRRLSREMEAANRRLARFARQATRIARVVGAAAAAAGAALIRSGLQTVDAQAKLAQSLATTTASVQVLARAADLSGNSFRELEAGSARLTRRLSLFAADGSGPAADAIQRLGLNATELLALPLDRRIARVTEAIRQNAAASEQAALFSQLFGDRAFVAFQRLDTAQLRQANEELRRFGVLVSDADADRIEETNDAISRLGLIWRGLSNQLAVAAAPALQSAAEGLARLGEVGGPIQRVFTGISDALVLLIDNFGRVASTAAAFAGFLAGRWVAGMAAAAISVRGLATALVVLRGALIRTGIGALIVGAGELIFQFTRLVAATGGIGEALGLLKDVAAEAWDRIALRASAAWARVEAGWAAAQASIYYGLQGATEAVVGWGNSTVATFSGAFDAVKATWGALPEAIGDFAFQAANALIDGVESMINGVVDRINRFITRLNAALSNLPDWATGEGGLSIGRLDPVELGGVENPFAGAASAVGDAAGEAFRAAMGRTYVEAPDLFGGMAADARGRAAGYAEAAGMLSQAAARPMTAWQALKDAVAGAGTDGAAALESATASADRFEDALGAAGQAATEAGAAAGAAASAAEPSTERAVTGWQAVTAALSDYAAKAREIGGDIGQSLVGAFRSAENAVGEFVKTGKLKVRDLVTSLIADLAQLAARRFILGPIAGGLGTALGGAGGLFANVLHAGGVVGAPGPGRMVPAAAFAAAPRMHSGGTLGLRHDEVPAILQRGERVLSRRESREYDAPRRDREPAPVVNVTIQTRDAESFRQSRTQVAADISRAVSLGRRGLRDMAFHEVRFPDDISRGARGGPERRTQIVELASGDEERNASWANSRRRYDVAYGIRRADDLAAVVAFFEARNGRLHGFRFKDWGDYKSGLPSTAISPTDQEIGTGNGSLTEFALLKRYSSGAQNWTRAIAKPVAGTVRVALGGVEQMSGWSVDTTTGLVTFDTAPAAGVAVTAGFAFDVPVRFDTDALDVTLDLERLGSITSIPLLEIRR